MGFYSLCSNVASGVAVENDSGKQGKTHAHRTDDIVRAFNSYWGRGCFLGARISVSNVFAV